MSWIHKPGSLELISWSHARYGRAIRSRPISPARTGPGRVGYRLGSRYSGVVRSHGTVAPTVPMPVKLSVILRFLVSRSSPRYGHKVRLWLIAPAGTGARQRRLSVSMPVSLVVGGTASFVTSVRADGTGRTRRPLTVLMPVKVTVFFFLRWFIPETPFSPEILA